MYSEQAVSAVRNFLQYTAGALGFGSYITANGYLAAASALVGLGTLVHAWYASKQAAQAKGK